MRRQIIEQATVDPIAGADLYPLHPVEHVDLGERDPGHAADGHRLADQNRVEPAAAALATGDGTEFAPALAKSLPDVVIELGREGARANAGGVGFYDPEHETRRAGASARAAPGCPGYRVGRGHERVSAVVDVEQHALRAFKQDPAALASRLVEIDPDRTSKLENEVGDLGEVGLEPLAVDRGMAETGTQRIMMCAKPVEQRVEFAKMGKVTDPDRPSPNLVFIGRTDATPGRADLARTAGVLAQRVEVTVDGKNKRTGFRDPKHLGINDDPLIAQPPDLVAKRPGIEHHPVTDDRRGAANNSGREQAELVGLALDHQGMTGIVAPLKAHDEIGPARKPVDDLALAFVAPLRADDGDVAHPKRFPAA